MPQWMDQRALARTSPEAILRRFHVRLAPVPILEMARDLEVFLWQQPGAPWIGALSATPVRADLWLRDQVHPWMRRWAAAHLLGHLMLHPLPSQYFFYENVDADNERERQADRWAADVLVPEWLLGPVVYSGMMQVAQLSAMFQITEQGMRVALGRQRR